MACSSFYRGVHVVADMTQETAIAIGAAIVVVTLLALTWALPTYLTGGM